MDELHRKNEKLKEILHRCGSAAVAFSGGVDSAFLLQNAHDVLGDRCVAVTASAPIFPAREAAEAAEFCASRKIRQEVFRFDALETENFSENPSNRCYLCKRRLFGAILQCAARLGLNCVADGSNVDDLGDYRPGLQAIAELGIRSPLREAGLTKADIRALSKELNLPTWNKPSCACLASRFVYGEPITEEKLHMIDSAESFLVALGFRQQRVRLHGNLARIEVLPEQIPLAVKFREAIVTELAKIGFSYVTLDLKGFRSGSMNET
ncbi:MAG: ATP-dependent sacrificial sulfur transferase LarE, partial [Pyramidobacter sp.]